MTTVRLVVLIPHRTTSLTIVTTLFSLMVVFSMVRVFVILMVNVRTRVARLHMRIMSAALVTVVLMSFM